MELEDKIRCNELLKEKYSNWLGLSNQKAIRSMLEELDRLQKENEELKEIDLTTVHIKGVCDEKERWRNKIIEKREEITDKYNRIYKFPSPKEEETPEGQLIYEIRFNTDSEALRIVNVILEELLEEE